MINSIQEIPDLTRQWLEPLRLEDRETWDELAESLLIGPAGERVAGSGFPGGVDQVLTQLDLAGKEIGAFQFAPAPASGATAADQLIAFDRHVREQFDVEDDARFIGAYGADLLIATPGGIVRLGQEGDYILLAQDFGSFLIAQANAYDAYKRHMVKLNDGDAYRAEARVVADEPALRGADVIAVYESQLTA